MAGARIIIVVALTAIYLAQMAAGSETIRTATSLGLTPEAVVVAGLQDSTAVILQRVEDAEPARSELQNLIEQAVAVAQVVSELATELRSPDANQQTRSQFDEAVAQLDVLTSQTTAAMADLRSECLAGAPADAIERLTAYQSCDAPSTYHAFRAVPRSSDEWKEVACAVRAERRALARGEPLGGPHAQVLANVRSDYRVAEAQLRIEQHLASVQAVFHQFDQ